MRRYLLFTLATALVTSSAAAGDNSDAYYAAAPIAAQAAPGHHVSLDVRRDVPTWLWVGRQPTTLTTPEAAARQFLRQHATRYRLSPLAIERAVVERVHDTGRGGILVVFRRQLGGVEIYRSAMKVLLTRQLELVAIGGSLRPELLPPGRFDLAGRDALAHAFEDRYGAVDPQRFNNERVAGGAYRAFDFIAPADRVFTAPARAKKVYYPLPGALVPAYYLELFVGRQDAVDSDSFAYVIAADDGRVLMRKNLTSSEAFSYRVWAETDGDRRPLDGPIADWTPHPAGAPNGSYPAFIAPSMVTVDGFNTNPSLTFDSWLLDDATETAGNNVDAYTDDHDPDGFSDGDLRASITAPGAFDRVYDPLTDPIDNDDQRMAAVTQLFYVNNWLHDWWYDSGFNEAAGNAQVDNYGRGGFGGDPILAQAQDGALLGLANNANMSTPADGMSPRMQMYLWSGVESVSLVALSQSLQTSIAAFGPSNFEVTANVVLVDDETGTTSDACQPIVNDVSDAIALIDRGTCSFEDKVLAAEAAGAVGVIIANDTPFQGPPQMGNTNAEDPTIGVLSVSFEDGEDLKDALASGPETATLARVEGPRSDSSIDNLIVTHEWGHFLHGRLVDCGSQQCGGQGEGWGDFLALMIAVREADDLSGTYASALYAPFRSFEAAYFGIRRSPYSRLLTKNAFTFRHIQDGEPLPNNVPLLDDGNPNSEVHATGEVWASMMFQAYTNLLDAHPFDEAQRLMADYVVLGMQLAPNDPTFTEQRDAILASAAASSSDDMIAIAEGFATRGAGSCAVSPEPDSEGNQGVVESYELGPRLVIEAMTLGDDIKSCDDDGVLDAGERGTLTFEVSNASPFPLGAATVSPSTFAPGLEFADALLEVGPLEPFSSTTLTTEVRADPAISGVTAFEFDLAVEAPESCQPSFIVPAAIRVNFDTAFFVEVVDNFDVANSVWTPTGSESDLVWSQTEAEPLNGVWHGIDLGHISDTALVSPAVAVDGPLALTLEHRYSFEYDADENIYWDGAVIEISSDGSNWQDVSAYDDPGYSGPLSNEANNPLSDQMAFAHINPGWPNTTTVTLNLGDSFIGETVRLRFRIGTDEAAGEFGWEIHKVTLGGIADTPFPALIDDVAPCNEPPIAVAGTPQIVKAGATVTLDGSSSSDPDGSALSGTWNLIDGAGVELDSLDGLVATFVAPNVEEPTLLVFELTVSDGVSEATDVTSVTVVPSSESERERRDVSEGLSGRACLCSAPGGHTQRNALPWLFGVALLVGRRRRRWLT